MTDGKPEATLIVGLGDTMWEAASRSSYPIDLQILNDEDLSAADRPVQFSYCGAGAIALPPTRTVAINSTATIVTGIEMAPQLEYLGAKAVVALADTLEPRLKTAGWVRDGAAPGVIQRDALALRLADPAAAPVTAWHIAVYRLGDVELTLRLRRAHPAGPGFPEGAYLLNFIWRSDKLDDEAHALAMRFRGQDGYRENWPRPIDAASYSKRIRAVMPRAQAKAR